MNIAKVAHIIFQCMFTIHKLHWLKECKGGKRKGHFIYINLRYIPCLSRQLLLVSSRFGAHETIYRCNTYLLLQALALVKKWVHNRMLLCLTYLEQYAHAWSFEIAAQFENLWVSKNGSLYVTYVIPYTMDHVINECLIYSDSLKNHKQPPFGYLYLICVFIFQCL